MSQNNNKNRKNNDKGGSNWKGVVSLVSWALLLTVPATRPPPSPSSTASSSTW